MSDENKLWAILVPGPDDVFAMASKDAAEAVADEHNNLVRRNELAKRWHMQESQLLAQVIEWPHDAVAHAVAVHTGEPDAMDTANGIGVPDRVADAMRARINQ